jgi:SAM-dependent methyltransferase
MIDRQKTPFAADYDANIRFFESLLEKYGPHVQAVGMNEQSQHKRFEVLAQVGNLGGKSLLDVGCGLGDFALYLEKARTPVTYRGVDISPRMIDQARRLRPQLDFEVADILTWPDTAAWDFVLSNGFGNILTASNDALMESMITKMFALCNVAVGVTMTSACTRMPREHTYYYDPETIVSIARKLSQRFVIRHDYMPHDLAVFIYKKGF